jgi:prevent-host-death family protein
VKEIQLREAKATLSAMVEAAENGEPTTITKHGRPAAVIVSHGEWTKLTRECPSLPICCWPFRRSIRKTCQRGSQRASSARAESSSGPAQAGIRLGPKR